MIGIYKITSPTGRIYIGQSTNIHKRFKHYKSLDCKRQHKIYNSLKKYGTDNHVFEIVEICKIEELNEKERFYQDHFGVIKNGLNCVLTDTNIKRKEYSIDTKIKASNSKKGSLNPMYGKKGELNPCYGKKLSSSHIKTLSERSGQAKIMLNLETGIFYDSLTKACTAHNLNYGSMMNKMQGYRKNNTSLIYI